MRIVVVIKLLYERSPLAVPFFFISSAFLLHLKVSNEEQSIKEATIIKFIKRMIRLYLMWSILYLPFSFYGIIVKKTSLVTSIFRRVVK